MSQSPVGSRLGYTPEIFVRRDPYTWPSDAPLLRAFNVLIIVPHHPTEVQLSRPDYYNAVSSVIKRNGRQQLIDVQIVFRHIPLHASVT